MKRVGLVIIVAVGMSWVSGCTHMQLRKNTVQQQRTTTEIVQQQIMDNVTKLAVNPSAWPHYSAIAEGSTAVTDQGNVDVNLTWDARSITQEALGLGGSRNLQESWGMKPETDPSRLRAMWAVYHYAIYGVLPQPTFNYDAGLQLSQIFGPDWPSMFPAPGWFRISCDRERCEKVHCGCVVGHYCDTQAHVLPGNEFALQELTFLIMHISSAQYLHDNKLAAFPTGIPGLVNIPRSDAKRADDGSMDSLRLGPARNFNTTSPGFQFVPGL